MNDNQIPLVLTAPETAKMFALPLYYVRRAAKSGCFISFMAGRKLLINAQSVENYLNSGIPQGIPAALPNESAGRIAAIPLRANGGGQSE